MDFELTEEQKAIRKTVKEFSEKELEPHVKEWEESGEISRDAFRKMAELGLTGINVPEKYGGMGLDYLTAAVVYESLAAGGVEYITVHNMVCFFVHKFGNDQQKTKYLIPLAKGELLGSFALTEPNAGSDVSAIETSAVLSGDKYVLNGNKVFITCAGEAEIYATMAKTNKEKGEISAFIVEKGTPGLSFGKEEEKLGLKNMPTREVIFEDCPVPADNLLGKPGDGFRIALSSLDEGRISVGALSVGGSQLVLGEAIKYAKQRVQFGRPIVKFQAIQFMLADMATQTEASRWLVYNAAYRMDHGLSYIKEASMAKMYATDVALKVAIDGIQILGGYGYTTDYGIERALRDAKGAQIVEGTNQIQRIIIAGELVK